MADSDAVTVTVGTAKCGELEAGSAPSSGGAARAASSQAALV